MKMEQSILRLALFRPGLFFLDMMFSAVFAGLPLLTGYLTSLFFEALTDNTSVGLNTNTLLVLLFVVGVASLFAKFGYSSIWSIFRYTIEALLRRNILDWLLHYSGPHMLPVSSNEAVTYFRDDVDGLILYLESWFDLFGQIITALVAFIITVHISLPMTIVSFLPIACIIAAVNMLGARLVHYRAGNRLTTEHVTGFIGELFSSVQAIKVASASTPMIRHLQRLNDKRCDAMVKDSILTQMIDSFNVNVVSLSTGMILILAGQLMVNGTFTIGDFVLFISYASVLTGCPRWIGKLLARRKQAIVSYQRLCDFVAGNETNLLAYSFLFLKGEIPNAVYAVKKQEDHLASFRVKELTYRYPGTVSGIENIHLDIERGSFTVLTGMIGSGKTTLLRVILGILIKEKGNVYWNDQAIDDPLVFLTPPRCAYTPQTPRLFSETIRDNMLLGLPEAQVDLAAAVYTAVLEDDLAEMESGLDTLVGTRGMRLSGGQIQRATAARMFVRDTELLIFDDLSSALDVKTEQKLWQRVFEQQRTCLVVSHRPAVLRRASHIVVLKDGKIDDEGTFDQLRVRCVEMQKLLAEYEKDALQDIDDRHIMNHNS